MARRWAASHAAAWRLALVGVAIGAALIPIPPGLVERFYSRGVYLLWEPPVTSVSDRLPFALIDAEDSTHLSRGKGSSCRQECFHLRPLALAPQPPQFLSRVFPMRRA